LVNSPARHHVTAQEQDKGLGHYGVVTACSAHGIVDGFDIIGARHWLCRGRLKPHRAVALLARHTAVSSNTKPGLILSPLALVVSVNVGTFASSTGRPQVWTNSLLG
jgi:hypothetical protein